MAFLRAGLYQPPSRALAVAVLARARRMAALHQVRGDSVSEWLASEARAGGIGDNAAALAVMELPAYRDQAAQAYALRHPDRVKVLNDLLAVLA
jgi:hypothetical protein